LDTAPPSTKCGSQQLFSALHDAKPPALQMLPGSRHAWPLSQRPSACVGDALAHVTGPLTGGGAPDHPQQSLLVRHTSPVGLHPDGGSQTSSPPVAPNGPHDREQQF
jgi:hypothetical protein